MSSSAARSARYLVRKSFEWILVLAIIGGCLLLWLGIPASFLWIASRVSNTTSSTLLLLLGACPLAMFAFGLVLGKLNGVYLWHIGAHPAQLHSAWMRSLTGDNHPRRRSPLLEVSMAVCAGIALVSLVVWFFFFAHSSLPASPAVASL